MYPSNKRVFKQVLFPSINVTTFYNYKTTTTDGIIKFNVILSYLFYNLFNQKDKNI